MRKQMGRKETGVMKQKVSDYIAEYIAQWGIRDVFTVTGGGAMHMNDAIMSRRVRWQRRHTHGWITVWLLSV